MSKCCFAWGWWVCQLDGSTISLASIRPFYIGMQDHQRGGAGMLDRRPAGTVKYFVIRNSVFLSGGTVIFQYPRKSTVKFGSTGTGTVVLQYRQKSSVKYRKTVYRLENTVTFRYRRKSTVKFGDTVHRQKWYREKSKYRQPFEKYRHFAIPSDLVP